MKLRDKVIVITGGANGIGAAMARRFAQESPGGIVIADIDTDAAGAGRRADRRDRTCGGRRRG